MSVWQVVLINPLAVDSRNFPLGMTVSRLDHTHDSTDLGVLVLNMRRYGLVAATERALTVVNHGGRSEESGREEIRSFLQNRVDFGEGWLSQGSVLKLAEGQFMHRSLYFYLTLGFLVTASAVGVALSPALAWAEKDEDEDDTVHELMEKTHEGKKSPWRKAERAASKDPVDWAEFNKALPRLTAMSKALSAAKNKEVRESADGYVDAVKELEARAKKMDAAGTRAALTALSKSCTDCHHKGGPGGKLDD
jgi:hypothetical protein